MSCGKFVGCCSVWQSVSMRWRWRCLSLKWGHCLFASVVSSVGSCCAMVAAGVVVVGVGCS